MGYRHASSQTQQGTEAQTHKVAVKHAHVPGSCDRLAPVAVKPAAAPLLAALHGPLLQSSTSCRLPSCFSPAQAAASPAASAQHKLPPPQLPQPSTRLADALIAATAFCRSAGVWAAVMATLWRGAAAGGRGRAWVGRTQQLVRC